MGTKVRAKGIGGFHGIDRIGVRGGMVICDARDQLSQRGIAMLGEMDVDVGLWNWGTDPLMVISVPIDGTRASKYVAVYTRGGLEREIYCRSGYLLIFSYDQWPLPAGLVREDREDVRVVKGLKRAKKHEVNVDRDGSWRLNGLSSTTGLKVVILAP